MNENKSQDNKLFNFLPSPNLKEGEQSEANHPPFIADTRGFIYGLSGVGKTQCLDKLLSFLPQIIHSETFSIPAQVIWLKLESPFITDLAEADISE